MSYHHGDLRRALLDAAASVIAESGVSGLSMRDLARRAGVSHAAPAHHFRDRAGLLTALAAEGFHLLADAMEPAGTVLDAGVAYVHFAVTHPAHFEVMFHPGRYHRDDAAVRAAQARSGFAGRGEAGLAGWSIAHGFATLWLNGAMPEVEETPEDAVRAVLRRLDPTR